VTDDGISLEMINHAEQTVAGGIDRGFVDLFRITSENDLGPFAGVGMDRPVCRFDRWKSEAITRAGN
jgi:hypothetical protein